MPKFVKILKKLMKNNSRNKKDTNIIKNIFDEIEKPAQRKKSFKGQQSKPENSDDELDLELEADNLSVGISDEEALEDLRRKEESGLDNELNLEEEVRIINSQVSKVKKKATKSLKKRGVTKKQGEDALSNVEVSESGLALTFDLMFHTKRTLFIPLIQELLRSISIRELRNIKKLHLIKNLDPNRDETSPKFILQTEGLNFPLVWRLQKYFKINAVESNDVQEIARVYGIEAGRNALAKEVDKVFSHYGIAVDFRHMSLVADHMSFPGFLNPMSRTGMQHAKSAFLKMSFETSMKFLVEACQRKEFDDLNTASGNIVVGETMKNGTGFFDVLEETPN